MFGAHRNRDAEGRIRGGRLLRRTFVLAAVLVSGGVITGAAVELVFRYRENVANVAGLQQEMAESAAFKIRRFVGDIEKSMRASAHSAAAISTGLTPSFRFQLLKLLKTTPAVMSAVAIDRDGREIVAVSRIDLIDPDDLGERSSDEAFQRGRQGKVFFGPVYFVRNSEPYMRIAVPIEWFVGAVEGVLLAEVNLRYIRDVVADIRVGAGGYAYVVSQEGDLIAHPDLSLVLQKRNLDELDQVRAALAGAPLPPRAQPSLLGESVVASYAAIPDLDWAVLVERPTREAYAPLLESVFRTFLLSLVALGMAFLASVLIIRKVVRPLGVLREGAARIGSGELDHRIEIATGDELEVLAEGFNQMTERLQGAYATLEQKVVERTRELRESNIKLEDASARLADFNQTLEQRVAEQVVEIEHVSRLKRFVAPQLADVIVASGDDRLLESHRREITVVFADLRGFTKFSGSVEPERLMTVLGQYHQVIGTLIHEFEATLERFAGDGVMVYFNDPIPCPDPAARAVRLAVAMRERVRELTDSWRARGDELGFGVGIALGYATLGEIGFEGRVDYAAIGPVTNLASRLCDEAKDGQILISQRVRAAASDLMRTESIGELTLKGFSEPVSVFNVVALDPDQSRTLSASGRSETL